MRLLARVRGTNAVCRAIGRLESLSGRSIGSGPRGHSLVGSGGLEDLLSCGDRHLDGCRQRFFNVLGVFAETNPHRERQLEHGVRIAVKVLVAETRHEIHESGVPRRGKATLGTTRHWAWALSGRTVQCA